MDKIGIMYKIGSMYWRYAAYLLSLATMLHLFWFSEISDTTLFWGILFGFMVASSILASFSKAAPTSSQESVPKRRPPRSAPASDPVDILWNRDGFVYPQIAAHQVRLLEIMSISLDPNAPNAPQSLPIVKGVFRIRNLTELGGVGYSALSYQWEADPEIDSVGAFISIDGKRFCLRRNVFDFLSHADRPSARTKLGRLLFYIDAICINQSDAKEKQLQVQHMRDVYSQAERVMIWLCKNPRWPRTEIDERMDRLDGLANVRPGTKLDRIFEDSYWTRVWIVQEVLLARQITLFSAGARGAGDTVLDLDDFIRSNYVPAASSTDDPIDWGIDPYRRAGDVWLSRVEQTPSGSPGAFDWGHAEDIIARRKEWIEKPLSQRHLTIQEAVSFACAQECTVIADKIYGFLGLLDRGRIIINPNYAKSRRDIYADVLPHLLAFIHGKPHTATGSLLKELKSERLHLLDALGIDDESRECAEVACLLLQMMRTIPLESVKSFLILSRGDLLRYKRFSSDYKAKAYSIVANQGIGPYLRYLDKSLMPEDVATGDALSIGQIIGRA